MTHSETQEILSRALETHAREVGLEARRRAWAGRAYAGFRARRREEARRCLALRAAVLTADPLELDALLDRR